RKLCLSGNEKMLTFISSSVELPGSQFLHPSSSGLVYGLRNQLHPALLQGLLQINIVLTLNVLMNVKLTWN
ncbi:hypothetical protein, partial [Flavonifractor plautii]|uniref:hypothetical protein n=1 Tax=Flavonifractor plautii TaxID=292800 RepID=UPI003D7D3427